MKTWSYACLMRPPVKGAIPEQGLIAVNFYDGHLPDGRKAWGTCTYNSKLTVQETKHYDLELYYIAEE